MGIFRRKKVAPPAEQDRPIFGLDRPNPYSDGAGSLVLPDRYSSVLPSRHEIVDPYANAPALQAAQMISHHQYTLLDRAWSLLLKATAITVALAILTGAAMLMFADDFFFFAWLVLASGEWVGCFIFLALLDFRETPAAHLRQKTAGYLELMKREQTARLRALYGHVED